MKSYFEKESKDNFLKSEPLPDGFNKEMIKAILYAHLFLRVPKYLKRGNYASLPRMKSLVCTLGRLENHLKLQNQLARAENELPNRQIEDGLLIYAAHTTLIREAKPFEQILVMESLRILFLFRLLFLLPNFNMDYNGSEYSEIGFILGAHGYGNQRSSKEIINILSEINTRNK